MRSQDEELALLAGRIRAYLVRCPFAADTVEGIARWWLPSEDRNRIDEVQEALEQLVAAGEVRAERGIDGRIIYSRAPRIES